VPGQTVHVPLSAEQGQWETTSAHVTSKITMIYVRNDNSSGPAFGQSIHHHQFNNYYNNLLWRAELNQHAEYMLGVLLI